MTAATLAKALGGKKVGNSYMARCPAHDDRNPSLSISIGDDGRILVHCFSGCCQAAVIEALQARGLWGQSDDHQLSGVRRSAGLIVRRTSNDTERIAVSLGIWRASGPATGTSVETYLASRGLTLPIPVAVRFHRGLKHKSGGIWPAMVALITHGIDDAPLAIHRTFLARDGSGKAPVEPAKMMLGPCRGGAVRLGEPGEILMIGEGIETCVAAMQATGYPAWAALSTSGLRALNLPREAREVIILADGDEAGEAAARDCALRWKSEGRCVRIARPPHGMDFNDVLLGLAPSAEADAR